MASRVPVLIAGAGPVGLAMAAFLHRQGVPFRIVDRNAERTKLSKALVVWPRTLELLRASGLAEKLAAAGLPVRAAQIFSRARSLVKIHFEHAESPYPYALFIPQSETERVIEERLQSWGAMVERETELTGFTADASGVTVQLKRANGVEEELRADWLIACDGAHSMIRHQLALPFSGVTAATQFLLADVHLAGLESKGFEAMMFSHQDGIMALFPIGPGHYRVIGFLGEFQEGRPEPTLALVQELIDRRGPGGLVASDPAWLAYFRINERKPKDYRAGRVFFCGDAAHVHSPAGGQGMNTGIQDACNLAWKLAFVIKGHARENLLDTFSAERAAVGDRVLRNAGAITRMATLRNPVLRGLRNVALTMLGRVPALRRRFFLTMSELDIAYPHSPLSRKAASASRGVLKPGNRAPDAKLLGPTGERITLFDLLSDQRFSLLILSDRERELAPVRTAWRHLAAQFKARLSIVPIATRMKMAPAGDLGRFSDESGEISRRYGTSGLVVVRPDFYVGLIAGDNDLPAVESYLNEILGSGSARAITPAQSDQGLL